jgi:hypothetical protein
MAIQSFKMGPGALTFGVAGAQNASAQVTKATVECDEAVKTTDAIPVLSGDELPQQDEVSLSWKLTGTVIQDIAAADLVAYTWDNASAEVPFKFTPSTAEDRAVSGTVRIVPLSLGGDVNARNTSDLSWAIIGTPDLDDATP